MDRGIDGMSVIILYRYFLALYARINLDVTHYRAHKQSMDSDLNNSVISVRRSITFSIGSISRCHKPILVVCEDGLKLDQGVDARDRASHGITRYSND